VIDYHIERDSLCSFFIYALALLLLAEISRTSGEAHPPRKAQGHRPAHPARRGRKCLARDGAGEYDGTATDCESRRRPIIQPFALRSVGVFVCVLRRAKRCRWPAPETADSGDGTAMMVANASLRYISCTVRPCTVSQINRCSPKIGSSSSKELPVSQQPNAAVLRVKVN